MISTTYILPIQRCYNTIVLLSKQNMSFYTHEKLQTAHTCQSLMDFYSISFQTTIKNNFTHCECMK
jgi:hypothetical protein